MNREIKFRAWWVKEKQMFSVCSIDWSGINGTRINLMGADTVDIDEIVLLQYTGLKDKNGAEIYEGDILKCIDEHTTIGALEYAENIGTYIVKYWRNGEYYYSPLNRGDISRGLQLLETEVIGNIYENPEWQSLWCGYLRKGAKQ